MTDTVAPEEIRDRVEALYKAHTDTESSRGAQRWFARVAGVDSSTVYRWVSGRMEPSPPVLALMRALEREAGLRDGGPAA